ncbi:hypothetical protein F5X96DRAFT_362619 [Biscogniauxia mediterranea]|nr:hypothetical protein F5X96DRAFT_362619 [Biscogniauxia mediterranea]
MISMDRSYFDTNLIEQWLSDCQDTHDYDCNETVAPMSLPKEFRLIYTICRCVIIPPDVEHYDFVTLGYVWSSASGDNDIQLQLEILDLLSHPGSLSAREIPPLIDDAIILCSSLGQRYLWVDMLCIIQDSEILNTTKFTLWMLSIIWQFFTIVALTNGIDAIGLPGSPN